jgi:hypothetical protein
MKERNTTNINYELCAINRQIDYFKELKYYENAVSCGGGEPYPLSGLDEGEFNKIKNKIIEMLNNCYNKKSDELIEFCKVNKK